MRAVGYDPLAPSLTLLPGPAEVPLEGRVKLLPGERRCAGSPGRGGYEECDRPVDDSPFCGEHDSWNPCAACRGTCLKDELTCDEPHVLYLALFAPDTLKVGVTRSRRFEERLREQGADAGEALAIFPNGRSARGAEARAPFRQRVPVNEKAENLHLESDTEFLGPRRVELNYFDEPIPSRPIRLGLGEPVEGRVLGVKGRLLVVEDNDTTYCLDLRDLLGFELDGESAPVQRSLRGFSRDAR